MKDVFDKTVSEEIIGRINLLNPNSKPKWGKMTVGQMLAHCSVTYEMGCLIRFKIWTCDCFFLKN